MCSFLRAFHKHSFLEGVSLPHFTSIEDPDCCSGERLSVGNPFLLVDSLVGKTSYDLRKITSLPKVRLARVRSFDFASLRTFA